MEFELKTLKIRTTFTDYADSKLSWVTITASANANAPP